MSRRTKLTWQAGSKGRGGRWRKKYKGRLYHFPGGRGKTDSEAYDAAVEAWEQKKLRLDEAAPKPHQRIAIISRATARMKRTQSTGASRPRL